MGKSECKCFEELSNFDSSFDNIPEYVKRVKHQMEYFLHIIQKHDNKEKLANTLATTKIGGIVIRNVLYYADLTRIHFEAQLNIHGNCAIQIPSKTIHLSDFLKCFEKLYHAWDLSLVLFYTPDSELPMPTLKTVLESHRELIQIFEKYNQFILSGQVSTITSFYGIQNLYKLFF